MDGVSRRFPHYTGERIDETRQEYANQRIREFQRTFTGYSFEQLLAAFRKYGELYDQGWRLRDGMEGAA